LYLPRLREWREAQGETQGTLGKSAGVALHTVHRIETGAPTTPPTARKLAEALGVSVADLVEKPPVPLENRPVPLAETPAREADQAVSGMVMAAKYHAIMGARLAGVLGPELGEREDAGDIKWLTRVSMVLLDYGIVLKGLLENVTLPDKETAEEIVAKAMDLNAFYARVEEALARAKPRAEQGAEQESADPWREIAEQELGEHQDWAWHGVTDQVTAEVLREIAEHTQAAMLREQKLERRV
jgi:transcriptional regulator with XRE-family HTH domain